MKINTFYTLLPLLLLLAAYTASADSGDTCNLNITCGSEDKTTAENGSICVYFFYSQSCPHCMAVEPFIHGLIDKYPQTVLKAYETSRNASNQDLFYDFVARYDIPKSDQGVPSVFIGDTALIGSSAIETRLEERIIYFTKNEAPCPLNYTVTSHRPTIQPTEITLAAILGAAVVDSINPCAIGVLLIFLAFLLHTNVSRKRILLYGGIYITAVYVTYLLAGIGILIFLQNFFFLKIIQIATILVLAAFAAMSFYDAYKSYIKEGSPVLAIPSGAKSHLKRYMEQISVTAMVILGSLVALVELPCSGAVYWGVLTLIASSTTYTLGIAYLLIYNVIFVMPLIVVLMLIIFGRNVGFVERTFKENTWMIRYFIGIFTVILAVILFFQAEFKIALPELSIYLSAFQWFFGSAALFTVLFFTLSFLRPVVREKIKIWFCAICYSISAVWSILAFLFLLGANVPGILLAGLIGMTIAGVWTELYKLSKGSGYSWFVSLFWINLGIMAFYSIFEADYPLFVISLVLIYSVDAVLLFIIKDEKPAVGSGRKSKGGGKKEGSMSLADRLENCCG